MHIYIYKLKNKIYIYIYGNILKQNVKNELLKTHNLLVYKFSASTSFRPWHFPRYLSCSMIYILMFI